MTAIKTNYNIFLAKLVMMVFTVTAFKPVATVFILIAIKLMDTVKKVVKPVIGENIVTMVLYLLSINLMIPSTTSYIVLVCVIFLNNVATLNVKYTGSYLKIHLIANYYRMPQWYVRF